MITMPLELYTDGSCSKNPGAGGLAYIIRYWDTPEGSDLPEPHVVEGSQGFRLTTNNRMEISAAIYGINRIIQMIESKEFEGATQLNLFSDSEYLCNAINQRWINKWQENNWMTSGWKGSNPQPVKNKDLWEQVIEIQNKLHNLMINLTLTHVTGHSGVEYNEKCDGLAVAATHDSTKHIIDEEYEKITKVMNRR